MKDAYWMRRALALARRGWGKTSPNPLVGAIVLDSNGRAAGSAFHPKAGEFHAEVLALGAAGEKARGGTLYVTLEPCCRFEGKRTSPCAELIIQSSVKRVVVASEDPNPLVNGKGIAALRKAGIDVSVGCLSEISDFLNAPFRTWIVQKRPLVTVKAAISLDGKLGARGKRIVLSGKAAGRRTMHLRAQAGAILVGVGTVLNDDPLLTVRWKYEDRKPIRAILDPHLRTPPSAKVLNSNGGAVWIFCSEDHAESFASKALKKRGARILPFPTDPDGDFSVQEIVQFFGRENVTALLVEGGAKTFSHFARAALIDRWVLFLTPRVLGSRWEGLSTVSWDLTGAVAPKIRSVIRRGADWQIVAERE